MSSVVVSIASLKYQAMLSYFCPELTNEFGRTLATLCVFVITKVGCTHNWFH